MKHSFFTAILFGLFGLALGVARDGINIFLPLVWENSEPVLRWCKDWKIDVTTGRFSAASE